MVEVEPYNSAGCRQLLLSSLLAFMAACPLPHVPSTKWLLTFTYQLL